MDTESHLVADVKARLDDMINDHVSAIGAAINWDIMKKAGTLTLVSGTNIYSLPSDCKGFRIFGDSFYSQWSGYRAARAGDVFFLQRKMGNLTGNPSFWRPYGQDSSGNSRVEFYPGPGSGQAGSVLNFEYSAEPASASADADSVSFNETMVMYFTLAEYMMYDGDPQLASMYEAKGVKMERRFMARSKGGAKFIPRTRRNTE